MIRWFSAAAFALTLHLGLAALFLLSAPIDPNASTGDAVDVDLMPDMVEPSDRTDDVSGQKVAEAGATSETAAADDPTPPAPDSAPPTTAKPKSSVAESAPPAQADAELAAVKAQDKISTDPPVETTDDAQKDEAARRTEASRASSGSTAQLAGGRRPSSAAKATWAGAIGSHLARLRRYPKEARAEGWQGTARVRVTIDGDGHVKERALVKSSGRALLDDEALALVQRSDPFPKPPAGMPTPVALTVPVSFAIR